MATDVALFIGPEALEEGFRFTDRDEWEEVRSQIIFAMNAGKGTITIPRGNGAHHVYVFTQSLQINWIDASN